MTIFVDTDELDFNDPQHSALENHSKRLIAIRLDPGLLTKLRKLAAKRKKSSQTLLHELLEEAVESAA